MGIWNPDASRFQMVKKRSGCHFVNKLVKSGHKHLDFKCFLILIGPISDPHCMCDFFVTKILIFILATFIWIEHQSNVMFVWIVCENHVHGGLRATSASLLYQQLTIFRSPICFIIFACTLGQCLKRNSLKVPKFVLVTYSRHLFIIQVDRSKM